MKNFLKFFVYVLFVSAQATFLMFIAPLIPGIEGCFSGLLAFIVFQAWAMYFLGGANLKMGGKNIAGYLMGILAAVGIILGSELVGSEVVIGKTTLGMLLAVFVVVIFVMSSEKIPVIDFIPSWFIGAGIYFALVTYNKDANLLSAAIDVMVACVVGQVFGWVTVTFRVWYEKKVGLSK